MLFTYQKKTKKLITSQTIQLPAVQEKGDIKIDITNTNISMQYNNIFSRVETTGTKCLNCS